MLENIQLISNFYKIIKNIHHNEICKKRNNILQQKNINLKITTDIEEIKLYKLSIMSSHNSYLSNYQNFDFADLSSVEFLIKLGVRCLEFDVYYINERLLIGHGTKNLSLGYDFITTNTIKLEDVFKIIKNSAFKDFSDLPLIINLELLVNNNNEAYQKIADKIQKYFYGYILHSKFHNAAINIGNCKMKHLRKKIIFITQKKLEKNNPLAKYINAYTYTLSEFQNNNDPSHILNLSFDEFLKSSDIIKKHIESKGLVRVYPNGSFIANFSTNYDFQKVISSGVQITAINLQQMGNSALEYINIFKSPIMSKNQLLP